MNRLARRGLIFMLIALATATFTRYRTRAAADEAARFVPAGTKLFSVPSGTTIYALVLDGVEDQIKVGDLVTAMVSTPVIIGGEHVIPAGTHLKAKLEQIEFYHAKATVRLDFTVLLIGEREFIIQTRRVQARVPLQSDVEILGAVFRSALAVSIGAAIGAVSGDKRLIARGTFEGILAGISAPESATPVAVVLVQDLWVRH